MGTKPKSNPVIVYNLPVDYTKLKWQERKSVREQYIKEQDNKCFYCNKCLSRHPRDDPY